MNKNKPFEAVNYIMTTQQKIVCAFVFLLLSVGSILECLGVSLIIPLVESLQNPVVLNKQLAFLNIDFTKRESIGYLFLFVIVVYLLKNLYFIFLSWVRIKFSCKIQREVSIRMLVSYFSRGYQFFLNKNYGDLYTGISGDVSSLFNYLMAIFKIVTESFTIILVCTLMVIADWILAVSMIAFSMLAIFILWLFFMNKMYKAGEKYRNNQSKSGQLLVQMIQGAKDIMIFHKQAFFVNQYEKSQIELQDAQCIQTVGAESPAYIIEAICITGLLSVVSIRMTVFNVGDNFVAILAAFAVGAFRILPSLGKISAGINTINSAIPGINSLYSHVVEEDEYKIKHPDAINNLGLVKNSQGLISKDLGYSIDHNEGKITFTDCLRVDDIVFKYNDEFGNVLEHVSFKVNKGDSVAIIGESGAGKTTLADVILGLLIPQNGEILLDGENIQHNFQKWSNIVGYVPQMVFLMDGTIRENIAFGVEKELIDDKKIDDLLERVELSEYVNSLPQGMYTKVGDRGIRLSGGQRQRIAIARALYHDPQIMILDEATSALDNDTEAAVMSAINMLKGNVTLIIIAHRLSTIKKCDVIYEVKDKRIREVSQVEVFGS